MHAIGRLMRFDKPIGTLLLLWPTCWGLLVAGEGAWPLDVWVVFLGGIVVMRAAGCVINDLADSQFDSHVERTQVRPLATSELSRKTAWWVFAGLMGVAFVLACQLNALAFRLAWVAAGLVLLYPLTKRFFFCPQAILGLAFSMGILMAFAQIQSHIPMEAWLLFGLSALWAIIYDTQYAMVDRPDDRKLGLRSSAIWFGEADRLILVSLSCLKLAGWAFFGYWQGWVWPFWCAWGITFWLFIVQWTLIWSRDRAGCFRAFLNNQWIGMVLCIGIAASLWR